MAKSKPSAVAMAQARKLSEAMEILKSLGFSGRQRNEAAGYTLLAMLDLEPLKPWSKAAEPRRGITPIITFIAQAYDVRYAPNTRETIRDEAVKFFVDAGMLLRNPDDPSRPVNSGKTVYQIEPNALALFRKFGTLEWENNLKMYLAMRGRILKKLRRQRKLKRIPVVLPSGKRVTISPGGQNPLIKTIIEQFCTAFAPGGTIVYIGDAENKFLHLDTEYLKHLNIVIPAPAKMPDVVIHDTRKNWLLLIEAVTSAGPVDAKRRNELKTLFAVCTAGLIFVTAFSTREAMRNFLTQISWETEVWVAEDPDHLIHFNGERFLGPYDD
ncbi:MAG TPA: BsuBI/PstI family type II restriction endonuclease [Phycisphaerae bacterium]|nr:BsuBI/PstI family type II restriction endonuclease [Phycisphaerae bacterium]